MKLAYRPVPRFLLLFTIALLSFPRLPDVALADDPITLRYEFAAPSIVPAGEYYAVTIEGLTNLNDAGLPRLPIKTSIVLIPSGRRVRNIKVTCDTQVAPEGSYVVEPGQEQFPLSRRGPVPRTPPSPNVYRSAAPFPGVYHSAPSPHARRGYQTLILTLYPVQYVPRDGELSYCASMTVRVGTKPAPPGQDRMLRWQPHQWMTDQQEIQAMVDNPGAAESYPSSATVATYAPQAAPLLNPATPYDYVIITNQALMGASGPNNFQALAAAKEARGISTVITTTEWISATYSGLRPDGGQDLQTKVRNFILDAYQTWGTEYVLLGGDGDGADVGGESGDAIVPHRGFYVAAGSDTDYDIPADMYYACLDGTFDYDADGLYAEPNDGPDGGEVDLYAEVYVGRAAVDSADELANFVAKTLAYESESSDYLRNVWMVGEDLGWPEPWGGDRKDDVLYGSSAGGYTTVGFEDSPYAAFLDTQTLYDRDYPGNNWPTSEIINAINSPAHIINHLGHANVTYVMKMVNSDVDNSLTNDRYFVGYSQGCYDGAFDNRQPPPGGYLSSDSISEHLTSGAHGAVAFVGNSRYGWGDAYDPHGGASQYYDRQFWDAVLGENIFNVGRANQDSKEDTYAVVGVGGFDSIMRWVYYELNLFGDPELIIKTGADTVSYQGHTIDDDGSGGSNGNGNGRVDVGETIEMDVTLFNARPTAVTTVTAMLSTADSYVTITDDLADYGDIPAGTSATSVTPYVFSVDLACPDDHWIAFTLDITGTIDVTGTLETWSDTFQVEVHSEPQIVVSPASYDETLAWGAKTTRTLTITNAGLAALEFEIRERNREFTPISPTTGPFAEPTVLVPAQHQNAMSTEGLGLAPAPTGTPLSAGNVVQSWSSGLAAAWGIAYTPDVTVWVGEGWGTTNRIYEYLPGGTPTGYSHLYTWSPAYGPADDAFNWNTGMVWTLDVGGDDCLHEMDPAAGYTGETICGPWTVSQRGVAYDPVTDSWYVGGWNEGTLYHIDSSGTLLDSANVGLSISGLAYNPDSQHLFVQVNSDPQLIYVLDTATTGYPQIGSFAVSEGFAAYGGAGLEFDCAGNLWAVDQGSAMVYQFESGESTSPCRLGVPWLSEQPITGTVATSSSVPVTITFDASQVGQPGIYRANLSVSSNDPYSPTVSVPVTMTVQADPNMGKLRGTVTSDRPGGALEGALVEVISGTTDVMSGTTDSAGSYGPWWLWPGTYTVTVSADGYLPDTQGVSISTGVTTTHDVTLTLDVPQIAVAPSSYDVTLPWRAMTTRTLIVTNTGPAALEFEIGDVNRGFAPTTMALRPPTLSPDYAGLNSDRANEFSVVPTAPRQSLGSNALLIQDSRAWGSSAIETILTNSGIPYDVINSSQIATASFVPYKMIIIPSVQGSTYNVTFNANLTKFEDFIDAGGLVIMSFCEQSSFVPYRAIPFGGTNNYGTASDNYIVDPSHPIFVGVPNPYWGDAASHSYLTDLLPGDRVLVTTGTAPGGDVVMIERDRVAGMLVAGGQTFEFGWANGLGAGTILENMIPHYYFNWVSGVDAPWLSEEPITGTVPAFSSMPVTITFDASPVTQPGTHQASLVVSSNDPYTPTISVPVTMTVQPDPNMGKLRGTVTSDRPGGALEGALVEVTSGTTSVISGTTDSAGDYGPWWLMNGTYTVIISAEGYLPDTQSVSISTGVTTTHDVVLALNRPQVGVAPTSFDETIPWGATATRTLTVTNTGPATLEFEFVETVGQFTPLLTTVASAGVNSGGHPGTSRPSASHPLAIGDFTSKTPSPVNLTCVTADPGTGYVYAQENGEYRFYRYDPFSDSWVTLNSCPIYSGNNGGAAYLDGKIYTVYTGNGSQIGVYNVAAGTWSTISNGLGAGTGNITTDGQYIYVVVGTTFRRYDPSSDIWSSLASPPISFQPWGGLSCLNGTIYGHTGNGTTGFAKYDMASDTWTTLSSVPGGAVLGSAVDPSGRVYYAYGPYGGNNWYAFDLANETWSVSLNPLFYVNDGGMAHVGQSGVSGIYFVQGEEGTGFGRFETAPHVSDVPWLSEEPITGTVPAYSSKPVTITFDAAQVTQPGVYQASLVASSNDPYTPTVSVPVTMTVQPDPNMGKLQGTVTSDRPGGPVEGALVEVTSGTTGIISGTTDSSGSYGPWWLMNGTYTVTILADGYLTDTQGVNISAEVTTTHDVTLPLNAPQVGVAPSSFDESLPWGATATRTMTITNDGPAALEFELFEIEGGFTPVGLSLGSGGPDDFGYTYKDSAEPGGPGFAFVDISTSGTAVSLGDDDYAGPFAVGFAFPFYGTDQAEFYVSSNGFLSFGSGSSEFINDCPLPSANTPHNLIALLWDDLDPSYTGDLVYYQTFSACPYGSGACLVVQYESYHHYPGGGAIAGTFEAVLFDNGNILIEFEDAGAEEGSESTTGIENASGTDGLTYGTCNAAGSLQDNLAICFQYPDAPPCGGYVDVPWLSERPITGTVPAYSTIPVAVTFDAVQVDGPGTYRASLRVSSNDPYNPTVGVPVTMTVTLTNTPPVLSGLPDQLFDHVTSPPGTLDLWVYASDAETLDSGLTYAIVGTPPAGAGVTLSGNRTVAVNPSPNWCGRTDVTIRATDPGGLSDTDTFRVAVSWSCPGPVAMPGAPVLIAPVDGRTAYSNAPAFAWHAVGGAQVYQCQVDDDAEFSSPEWDETTSGLEYVPATGLNGGTYYWRVRAVRGSQVGAWSARWAFTVPTPALPGFKLYLPAVVKYQP